MKTLHSLALLAAFASTSVWAQLPPVTMSNQSYQPLTGATTITYTSTDDQGVLLPLGFTFPYFGQNYTHVMVSTNGVVVPGTSSTTICSTGCLSNLTFPSSTAPNPSIAGFWDDLVVNASSSVRYLQSAGTFVVEYVNVERLGSAGAGVTFQIKLTSAGTVTIHYGTITGTPTTWTASAGFENETGTVGANLLSGCTSSCSGTNFPVSGTLYTIGEPNEADLTVPTVGVSDVTPISGGNFSMSVATTFRNFGRTDANNFMWAAYLSRDQRLDLPGADGGADIVLAQGGPVSLPRVNGGVMADGGLSTVVLSGTLSTTTAPPVGEYYVLGLVDSTNVVTEASEVNNVGASSVAFVQGPDLLSTSISGPATTGGGSTENFSMSFLNRGNVAAPGAAFRILVSADQTLDTGDYPVFDGTRTLAAGQTLTETIPVVIPNAIPNGEFYFLLQLDPAGALAEAVETNNVSVSSAKVQINRPDLVAERILMVDPITGAETSTARFGEPARFKVRYRNTGIANAGAFKVGVVLSTDSSVSLLSDVYVCDTAVASAAAGAPAAEVTLTCTLPLVDTANVAFRTGSYFIFGIVDATGSVFEINKGNNSQMVGPVRVGAPGADLMLTSVVAPATAGVGDVIPIVRGIQNIGNVDAPAVTYRYYASANDIITTQDVPLRIVDNGSSHDEGTVTLAKGTGDTATELVQLPGSMVPGNYHIGCIVDAAGVVTTDLDLTNNAAASLPVVVAAAALRVSTTGLPDAVVGRPFSFRLSAGGEQGASTWRIETSLGSSPGWLTVGANDGLLTGTPPEGSSGITALTVAVENHGQHAISRLALRVLPVTSGLEVLTTSLPAVANSSGLQYQYKLGASGGVQPYSWNLLRGPIPNGLVLSSDGSFSGAPRSAANGSYPITVEVRDAVGGRATRELTVRLVAAGAITFRTVSIPDALVGQEYLQDIAVGNQDASALAKPLIWRTSGSLPSGITLTPQAELITVSGRATQAGRFSFRISVEDSNGRSDSLEFAMTVHAPRYRVVGVLPDLLRPKATVSVALGVAPAGTVTYRVVNGALPPGLTLDSEGLLSGVVAPEGAEGAWPFVIEVRDAAGMSGLTPASLKVEREPRAAGCSSTGDFGSLGFGLVLASLVVLGRRRRAAALGLTAAVSIVPQFAQAQYQVVGPTPAVYQPLSSGIPTAAGTALNIPFSMPFFDTQITSVTMSRYGYLAVGGSSSAYSSNTAIPHNSDSVFLPPPRTFLAPWWDALGVPAVSASGYRYQVTGTAPTRVMAFEWNAVGGNSSTYPVSFQVLLYESTGRIRFVYSSALPGAVSASVGIQKDLGVGVAGLSCGATGVCSSTNYPQSQAIDFYQRPDLEVTALSTPRTGYTGVPLSQTATIRNRGGREVTNVSVRFYLSEDATLNTSTDVVVGTATVASIDSQATAQATLTSPLPGSLSQSAYFLFAVVDPDFAIEEQSEMNNTSVASALNIGSPAPDLVVSAFSAPTVAAPGAMLMVNRTFQNQGNADSVTAKYTYFLSDNALVSIADQSLGVNQLAPLTPAALATAMDPVTLPADLVPGRYWLGVCVNFDAATSSFGNNEITIVNNCHTQNTPVQVSSSAVAISTEPLPTATQHAPYGLRLRASGGSGSYIWEMLSGALPAGLTFTADGDVQGFPSVAGAFSFEVKVTSGTASDTKTFSLQVVAGGLPLVVVDQSLTAAEFGRVYSSSLIGVGGTPPYRWRAIDPQQLPPGLGIAADGLIEGRPVMAGDFSFGVEVTDAASATASKVVSIRVVTPTSLAIATSAIESASVGRDYVQPLVAVGGSAPYAWSVVRFQELPENITDAPGPVLTAFPPDFGISIDDRDTVDYLSGTPRKAGLYSLTLKVTDGATTEDTASFLLRVSYRDGLAITTLQLPDAFVNQPYQARLSHNGGSDAFGIAFSEACVQQAVRPGEFGCVAAEPLQKLPVGLSLGSDGTIFGTPQAETGTYTFLVKMTDGLGRQDVRALGLRVKPDFSLERSSCSSLGLGPSLLALLLAGLRLRRRRVEVRVDHL